MNHLTPPDCLHREAEKAAPTSETYSLETPLSPETATRIFERIPLFVLADDDPIMLRTIFRIIKVNRNKGSEITKFEGDMTQCFDALPKTEDNTLPIITCTSGAQAKEATLLVEERQINDGVYVFDNIMGTPFGLEIFKRMAADNERPRIARVLFSGSLPEDDQELIENGTLDGAIAKPLCDWHKLSPQLAQAYVKAQTSK